MDLDAHAKLMDVLFDSHERAVPDGPVDPERYGKIRPRILWILREVNDQDSTRWRLSTFLNVDKDFETYSRRWSTYGLVAKASFGLLRGLDDIGSVDVADARDSLRDVAVINVKKVGGAASVDWKSFRSELKSWSEIVQKQIDLLDPDIVICGGTWDTLQDQFPFPDNSPSGVAAVRHDNRFWVRMFHPGQMTRPQGDLYKEMLKGLDEAGWSNPVRAKD